MWYLGAEGEDLETLESEKVKKGTHSNQMHENNEDVILDILPVNLEAEHIKSTQKNVSPSRPSTPIASLQFLTVLDDEKLKHRIIFSNFLKSHTCYDIIPASGKSVVLDIDLPVKPAFHALEENGVHMQFAYKSHKYHIKTHCTHKHLHSYLQHNAL